MTDIELIPDANTGTFDIAMDGPDLRLDNTAITPTLVSLFTDRRADEKDILPQPNMGRRGWWGDLVGNDTTYRIGSKLWLLEREKTTPDVPIRAKDYMTDALQWELDDGVAAKIQTDAEREGLDRLLLKVVVYRGDEDKDELSYQYVWR